MMFHCSALLLFFCCAPPFYHPSSLRNPYHSSLLLSSSLLSSYLIFFPSENFTFISSYAEDGTGQVGVYERSNKPSDTGESPSFTSHTDLNTALPLYSVNFTYQLYSSLLPSLLVSISTTLFFCHLSYIASCIYSI